jgi:V/A-type H+-transporting ATPase subunit A
MFNLVLDICEKEFDFEDFEECGNYYKKLINILRQMNYTEFHSAEFEKYLEQLNNEINNGK